MLITMCFLVTISSIAALPINDHRTKRQAWGTLMPTAITYEPEMFSRLSSESCDCIEARQCPEFLEMLQYRSTHSEQLRRLTCGFRGFQPMVCCNQVCQHVYVEPSPTPFHTPGVYYNIPDVQPTSERNFYSKRYTTFQQNVTPRTFDMRHKHYFHQNHWDNNPSPPYYPKYPFYPMFPHHKDDSDMYPPPDPNYPEPDIPKVDVNNFPNKVNISDQPMFNDSGNSSITTDTKNSTMKQDGKRALLPSVECGVAPGERILGGKAAALGEYPWIARIGYIRNSSGSDALLFRCGGSLINSRYVVTAAHCVTSLPTGLRLARVRLGELDERTDPDCSQLECADPVQDFLPDKVVVHQQYNTPKFRHDVALIRLDHPVAFTNYISPICLPFDSLSKKSYVGLKSDTAGWGATDLGVTSSSPVLQWVRVTVISSEQCARVFADRTGTRLGRGQLCAGGDRGRDSCEGDSGGPLMRREQLDPDDFTRYYLLGLVSFGAKRCGSENLPGVYTDITVYLDWILDNIEP